VCQKLISGVKTGLTEEYRSLVPKKNFRLEAGTTKEDWPGVTELISITTERERNPIRNTKK
jgi:hypothetical protein